MIGRKRFWKGVSVAPLDRGYGVFLDGKPLSTPERRPLAVPTETLAAAIAMEWEGIAGDIRPDDLPFTRAANSAIDRVSADPVPVVDALAAYGETDLVCYRADGPAQLQDRQAEFWNPLLDWARQEFGAPLIAVAGVMHQAQPPASVAALRDAVAAHDAFALTALHDLVTLSGSLVLALAVSRGALAGEAAWSLSRLDEIWQAEQWGQDHDAELAASEKSAAFLRAETLLTLLRG